MEKFPFCATAQFGNEGETSFRKDQQVLVLASKGVDTPFESFLVYDQETGTLGRAVKSCDSDVAGQFYSTNARALGGDWSIARSCESLGFAEEIRSVETLLAWSVIEA
jgi:hypothetical protein